MFTNNYGSGLEIGTYTNVHNHIIFNTSTIYNSAFTNNTVGNIGGGLLLHTHTDVHNNITVTNNAFTNNTAHGPWGGGLIIKTGTGAHNNITITNSVFTNNTIGTWGGGLHIFTATDTHNNITITNNAFANNKVGNIGGGLAINTGTDTDNNITINNSAFTNNIVHVWGGGLYIYTDSDKDSIIMITNSYFANNYGSGISAINHVTLIFTEGHSIVAENSSPADGGGVFLSGNSFLTTSNGGHVSFINNTAHRYGGAIYSTDNDFASLRCEYYSYFKYYSDQCTVYNLSATFINNSAARAGDQLYGGVFTYCKGYYLEYLQTLLQCNNVPDTLKYKTSVHPLSPVSSDPIAACSCVNNTVDCNITSLDREVYPGQLLNVSLVTVGLCGGVSPGTVVVVHNDRINLISAATTDYTYTSCTAFNYNVKLINYISNTAITFNVPDGNTNRIRPINVNLTILPCPLGLVVNFTLGDCVCSNDITHISGVICNSSWMPYPIQ